MKKKIVLITGASSGLGRQIAEGLSDKGFKVLAGIRSDPSIKSLRKYWQDLYPEIKPIKLDVTSNSSCKAAIDKIITENGGVDVLINCAGLTLSGKTDQFNVLDLENILQVNCVGAFRLIKHVLPNMKSRKRGKIINITSINGHISLPFFGLYSASKFAIEALGTALYYELKKDNVFVTNIAPGAIKKEGEPVSKLIHKPLRERFFMLKIIFPIQTEKVVAERIIEVVELNSPPSSLTLGRDAYLTLLVKKLLPRLWWDKIIERLYL